MDSTGSYISFTTNSPSFTLYVKGGPAYDTYDYTGTTTHPNFSTDAGLHSPYNNGGNIPLISHYLACGQRAMATPSIATTQQPSSATVGSSIADQATVSGGSNPTGTVTFNLYNNANASGTPLFTDTETLSNGSATSQGYTTTAAGTDYWVATYNGDSNNNAVSSGLAAESVTVTGIPSLAWSPAPYDFGSVIVGQKPSQVFTLTNSGTGTSGALTASLTGSSAFSVPSGDDTCTGTQLAPTQSCQVTVQYAPTTAENDNATLAAGGASVTISGSAGHIYWANQGDGTIKEAPVSGGTATTLVSGQKNPFGVAVDANHIYWANQGDGTIDEAPLSGGTATTLVSGQNLVWGVAVDANHIYWGTGDGTAGTIEEAPLSGGTATTLVSGQFTPFGVAVDANHIYWSTGGTIEEAPLSGGTATTLVSGLSHVVGVAVDANHIYCTSVDLGTIFEAPLSGGTATTLVPGQTDPQGVAVDANHIYWG
ncbi:MAG: choice-of-anchor D domain-containing protein, partial [Acidimicrobiales bacterium]